MNKIDTINFNYNWNNKLNSNSFTTLRLGKKKVGELYAVHLGNKPKCTARCIDVKEIRLHQINEFIARLDTGYSAKECKEILKAMYKTQRINWERQPIYLHLFVKETQDLFSRQNEKKGCSTDKANT